MKIVDCTKEYNGKKYIKYLRNALSHIPEGNLKNIGEIIIHDRCPCDYPVIAQGGYHPATSKKKGVVELYLDQSFGHLLTYNQPKGIITKFFDSIFIHSFGKLHLIHTVFHEIGHQVFEDQNKKKSAKLKKKGKRKQIESEKLAENHADELFGIANPSLQKYYPIANSVYRFFYSRRRNHDNKMREKRYYNIMGMGSGM